MSGFWTSSAKAEAVGEHLTGDGHLLPVEGVDELVRIALIVHWYEAALCDDRANVNFCRRVQLPAQDSGMTTMASPVDRVCSWPVCPRLHPVSLIGHP